MYDRKTSPLVQKIDAMDSHPLPGASLQLEDTLGNVFETWISSQSPYEVQTPLSPETTYRIRETAAPPGYQLWKEDESISFHISNTKAGSAPLLILADNQPESPSPEPPKEPEEPEKPVRPNPPNNPNPPAKPCRLYTSVSDHRAGYRNLSH